VHGGRVARQHDAERLGDRVEAQDLPALLAEALVQHPQVEAARQAPQHVAQRVEHAANLLQVAAHEHVRHPGRRRHLPHVVLRRLRRLAQRQLVLGEMPGRARARREQLLGGELRERRPRLPLRAQVAPDEPDVRLTHLDERLARPVVNRARHLQTPVRLAPTKNRDV
jgi:hypothetical protein